MKTGDNPSLSIPPLFWVFLAAGVLLRGWTLLHTADAPLPPDLWHYLSLARSMAHPYDTHVREPLFVWICRLVQLFTTDPRGAFAVLRATGVVLYAAVAWTAFRLGRRVFSVPIALGACLLLAINWSQVENDVNGLRNAWEGLLFLVCALILFGDAPSHRRWVLFTVCAGLLSLLKMTYLPTFVLLLPPWFLVRRWKMGKALLALGVMLAVLLPHFRNNKRIGNDYFHSNNFLTRNFRNIEFAGRPGFPTREEVALDAFAPPDVTTWEMMFVLHTPLQAAAHTAEGVFGLLWGTAVTRYLAKNTAWFLYAVLLPCYFAGTLLLLRRVAGRLLVFMLVCFVLPFAFFKHVYWAYRYVVPLAPLVSLVAFGGLAGLTRLWTERRRRRVAPAVPARTLRDDRREAAPLVSFIVPAYNERAAVRDVLERLSALPLSKEVLVVDDGSTDGTRELLSENPPSNALLIVHERNAGKGAALRTALQEARGRYAAVQDADGEYDPDQLPPLLDVLQREGIPVLYGSRFLTSNPTLYRRYWYGNKTLTAWLNLLCGARYTDAYTGCKIMETALFRDLAVRSNGFEVEAEVSVKLAVRGIRARELPIRYRPRSLEEGKKIGWKDAFKGAWTVLACWWEEGNRGFYERRLQKSEIRNVN